MSGKVTKSQLRYLADIPQHPPGRRAYNPFEKRMYPKLLDLDLVRVSDLSGLGRSATTYYVLTDTGVAALNPTPP